MENTKAGSALVIAGGRPIKESLLARVRPYAWIVAADSGLDQAMRLGLRVDLVIGDMDSVSPAALAAAEEQGVVVERHPRQKDATDLELAIDAAVQRGYLSASIIGGTGGRLAHTLANAMLLTRRRPIELEWITSHARIRALRRGESASYRAPEGEFISILAVGGAAGCTSSGLRWPLAGAPLRPGETRGVSNEIEHSPATISVIDGQVLTIQERNSS